LKSVNLVAALYLSASLTLVAALGVACQTHDPHWVNRGGSFIAALAAIAVYFQIRREIKLEADRRQLEARTDSQGATVEGAMPLEQAAHRLETQRRERQGKLLTAERVSIGLAVAVCAFVGECLHGFGDLLLKTLIRFVEIN
jgi:hypothetical protein